MLKNGKKFGDNENFTSIFELCYVTLRYYFLKVNLGSQYKVMVFKMSYFDLLYEILLP